MALPYGYSLLGSRIDILHRNSKQRLRMHFGQRQNVCEKKVQVFSPFQSSPLWPNLLMQCHSMLQERLIHKHVTPRCKRGSYINNVTPRCKRGSYINNVTPCCKRGSYMNNVTPRCKRGSYINNVTPRCKRGSYINNVTPCCKRGSYINKVVSSYTVQYPVLRTAQSTLHFTSPGSVQSDTISTSLGNIHPSNNSKVIASYLRRNNP